MTTQYTTLSEPQIAFIGGGNMAKALIGGLLAKQFSTSQLNVLEINPELHGFYQEQAIAVTDSATVLFSKKIDVVVLAVKPQVAQQVLSALASYLKDALVISIIAGLPIDKMAEWLSGHERVIRAMPNTPALVQQGATGLFAPEQLSNEDKQLADTILSSAGIVKWVSRETDLHAVTAVSGSGPAYFFYLMEAMIEAGIEAGLTPEVAKELTLQTALGSALIAVNSAESPQQLRKNVTSPNGTTQSATDYLDHHQVNQLLKQAVLSADARSKALAG